MTAIDYTGRHRHATDPLEAAAAHPATMSARRKLRARLEHVSSSYWAGQYRAGRHDTMEGQFTYGPTYVRARMLLNAAVKAHRADRATAEAIDALEDWDCGSGRCDPNTGCPDCNHDRRSWTRRS